MSVVYALSFYSVILTVKRRRGGLTGRGGQKLCQGYDGGYSCEINTCFSRRETERLLCILCS